MTPVTLSSPPRPSSESNDVLSLAKQILTTEALALQDVVERLDKAFVNAVEMLALTPGRIVVSGIGKSADVAQKIVGTLNSTGSRASALDPTRALHGDLGMIEPKDIALILSHSGESEEVIRLLGPMRRLCSGIVAITGNRGSTLARYADHAIVYGPVAESDPLGLAPSTSTTVMMALGDAIAFVLAEQRRFSVDDFARYHPAGSLGRKLALVDVYMRRGSDLRLARASDSVRKIFSHSHHQGRRTGAIMLVDDVNKLVGIFTDSDLARLFEKHADMYFDRPCSEVMTKNPIAISSHARMCDAIELMRVKKISELPVVDSSHHPIGMLDVTDIIGILPMDEKLAAADQAIHDAWMNRKSA